MIDKVVTSEGAAIPASVSLLLEDRPTPWQLLGVATANRPHDVLDFARSNDPCLLAGQDATGAFRHPVPYPGDISFECGSSPGKPWLVAWHHLCVMAAEMLGICRYHTRAFSPEGIGFDEFGRFLKLNAGIDLSPQQIWEAAWNAFSLERMLSRRGREAMGRAVGRGLDESGRNMRQQLSEFYSLMKWDDSGVPPAQEFEVKQEKAMLRDRR
jgi:hypothetical protein